MGHARSLSLGLAGFLLVLGLINGAIAQSNSTCSTSSLFTLAPCLPYVSAGNTSHPGSDCCTPLGSLLTSDPTCLCQIGPLAKQSGVSINETRALEVATLCKLTVPSSLASCLAAVSGPSPLGAPSGSPPSTPSTPSQGGSSHQSGDGGILSSPFSSAVGSVSIVVISAMLTL